MEDSINAKLLLEFSDIIYTAIFFVVVFIDFAQQHSYNDYRKEIAPEKIYIRSNLASPKF